MRPLDPAEGRDNLRSVALTIEHRRAASSGAFLLFAFSPLPSNALFLAYGLTRAPLALLAAPFFVGRFVSYAMAFAGGAFAAQIASLCLVYLFTKIDWRRSRVDRRPRWLT